MIIVEILGIAIIIYGIAVACDWNTVILKKFKKDNDLND